MRINYLIYFLSFFSSLGGLFGQTEIRFENMGMERGLSNMNTSCIIQDSLGYIWVGTDDGLNRFDGYEFTTFTYGSNEKENLNISNNRIFELIEGDSSNLWIGTYDGLNKYDRRLGRFFTYRPLSGQNNSDANIIYSLFISDNHTLWVGTGAGLYAFDTQKNNFIELPDSFGSLRNQIIHCIVKGPGGSLFIGAEQGIYTVKNNQIKLLNIELYSSREVISLLFDSGNKLWAGHFNSGISIIDLNDSTSNFIRKGQESYLPDNYVYDITQNKAGEIWVATDNGLARYKGKGVFEAFTSIEGDVYSLSSDIITSILIDDKERMWVSTRLGGICLYDPYRHQFNHIKKNGYKPESLSSDKITGFAETRNGDLIIGTDGGGINIFNEEDRTFRKITKEQNGIASNKTLSLKYDSKGNLWIGTWGNGLNKISPEGQISHYVHDDNDKHSLTDDNVYVIFEDSKNNIWIGTWGNGISKYDPENDSFINYTHNPDNPDSFAGSAINQIVEDYNGDLLIVTEFKGFDRFDPESGKFKHYKAGENKSISLNALNSVLVDSKNRIWIGTNGAGLNLYDRETDSFEVFTTKDGLPNNVIVGLLEDDKSNIWISTNRGICKFDPVLKTFQNFDVDDGLQGYQFMPRSALKLSDGRLVFGGNSGLNLFDPYNIKVDNNSTNIFLSGISLFHEPLKVGDEHGILENSLLYTKKITLDNDQNFFTIHFTGINFTSQNDIVYAYQMSNLNDDWVLLGKERVVSFTTLKPGDYTFRIKASINGVDWSENPAELSITILPPWWKTTWAYILFSTVFIMLLLGFRYLVVARTNYENNLKLVRLERENLENTNKAKLQFFTNVSHEFRTPLTLILGPIENLIEKTTDKYTKQQLNIVKGNASRLLNLINQLLDFRKAESGNLKIRVAEGNFVNFVKEIKLSFDSRAEELGISFNIFYSSNIINLFFDRDQFEKILYNLLSNSFKNTPKGGEVVIKIIEKTDTVDLIVEDNGKGIPEENFDKIFTRFYSSEKSIGGTGIGLALVNNLVRLHHADITFNSIENELTEFKISIKKGREHFKDEQIIDDFKNSEQIEKYLDDALSLEGDLTNGEVNYSDIKDLDKILVVEDNADVRSFIKSTFLKNYVVLEASNGEEALELAIDEVPDLVISDVMMPVMDGISLCKNLKTNTKTSHIPVILLTARTSLIFETEGYESGADGYISKPFSSNLLKVRVNNLIRQRKQLREIFNERSELQLEPSMFSFTSSDEIFIKSALESIERNMSNSDYSVEDLGKDVGLSRMQLYRKLKSMLGLSGNEFIRNIRLKRAAQLLKTGQYTVSETTYLCGFSDLQYFRKCFKKQFKINPSSYKDEAFDDVEEGNNGL
ncbi:hybrid sensor histidine kinase/response regulator transcription factor [Marinigracilibium pacificum]|uniref:histidine kinase n=1 Tax=Marinigracilibium pacificum TaxID=2729599 RepID=A0A848J4L2_9BACT|nr:two-component regulator propeller domain-containing protein [Marinigracilibium pacificum]NMM49289.1 response regulator [Marinigracilibium pacificum]